MTHSIQHLRDLLGKATPGPWQRGPAAHQIDGPGGLQIAATTSWKNAADRELIVAAINAMPALLAIAEAANDVIESRYHIQFDLSEKLDALECATIDLRSALALLPLGEGMEGET
jgi:hypothetical protein